MTPMRISKAFAWMVLALLLVPTIDLLDHGELHAETPGFQHDEASHPNAAPHLDEEEHLGPEICLACAHLSVAAPNGPQDSGETIDLDLRSASWTSAVFSQTARPSAPTRGPPA